LGTTWGTKGTTSGEHKWTKSFYPTLKKCLNTASIQAKPKRYLEGFNSSPLRTNENTWKDILVMALPGVFLIAVMAALLTAVSK
jgi:hypothetical protein